MQLTVVILHIFGLLIMCQVLCYILNVNCVIQFPQHLCDY